VSARTASEAIGEGYDNGISGLWRPVVSLCAVKAPVKARYLAKAAAALGTVLFALPAAAEALPPNTTGSVNIGRAGKHGRYGLELTLPNDHAAVLEVRDETSREVPSAAWNRYAVVPTSPLSSGTLRADFGSLGKVSLRFRPEEAEPGRVPRDCRGRAPQKERGTYRGTIALRGENGFFSVDRVAVPGTRRRRFSLECGGPTGDPSAARPLASYVVPAFASRGDAEAQLEILSETPTRTLAFEAWRYPSGGLPARAAAALEVEPTLAIGRYSYLAAPALFQPAEPGSPEASPLTAMLGPVTYNADPMTPATWSGELSETFLGGLEVVINGPGSRTRLCAPDLSATPCVGEQTSLLAGTWFEPEP
jgi:hypothetical protein